MPHDRDLGFSELDAAIAQKGIRSPLCALVVIGYYVIIPSFAPVLAKEYLVHGRPILEEQVSDYAKCLCAPHLRSISHSPLLSIALSLFFFFFIFIFFLKCYS